MFLNSELIDCLKIAPLGPVATQVLYSYCIKTEVADSHARREQIGLGLSLKDPQLGGAGCRTRSIS